MILREERGAFWHHLWSKRTGTIPRHGHFQRAVPKMDGLGVRPVAVIALLCGFHPALRLTVGMAVAQMCIHFRLQTGVNRCPQQTFDQIACIINSGRQLAYQAGQLRIFLNFSLISLTLAGLWPFFGDTAVIISETPSRSEPHTQSS